jgi:hypothetical protein
MPSERGSATLEAVFAIGFLLIPAAVLLAQLPRWIATGHAAQIAAARQVVLADDMAAGVAAAQTTATQVIANHGLGVDDLISVDVVADPAGDLQRGQTVTVTVTVRGNPIVVPGLGTVGNPFDAIRAGTERVDDYRSFGP